MSVHSEESPDHISVCICTFKRPVMLKNLLHRLTRQITENRFTYSVIVVDNDSRRSAWDVVLDWQNKSVIEMDYFCESRQNIALARNKAVENARGNYIAFIDDDEFPDDAWLMNLLAAQKKYQSAGVLGPVKPFFEVLPPEWIRKGKICERSSFPTGTILKKPTETRTGNVLLRKELFTHQDEPFNPDFGLTGGEDVDFFQRKMKEGFFFTWCDEAIVHEVVPRDRFQKKYHVKRALLRGVVNSKKTSLLSIDALKSTLALIVYTAALPFFLLLGQHHFMKYLIKDCDHLGKITGLLGFKIITER